MLTKVSWSLAGVDHVSQSHCLCRCKLARFSSQTTDMDLIEDIRRNVRLTEHTVQNVSSTDFPGTYEGHDDAWSLEKFKEVDIVKISGCDMEFDMIGVDAAIANAIRRIIMAESLWSLRGCYPLMSYSLKLSRLSWESALGICRR